MTTVQDFLCWIERDLSRFGRLENHIEIEKEESQTGTPLGTIAVRLYTDTNRYSMVVRNPSGPEQKSYLGCTSSSRKPRAGEDWTRGSDLHDGPLSEETWRRILADIVSHEMVRVHKPAQAQPDLPETQE